MQIYGTESILHKVETTHGVTLIEIEEAFFLHNGHWLIDDRGRNKTTPPTVWFIGETSSGRLLKIVIIPYLDKGICVLRTAYEPELTEVRLYEQNN